MFADANIDIIDGALVPASVPELPLRANRLAMVQLRGARFLAGGARCQLRRERN